MTNYSPLRYPGGKGKLAPYLREIIKLNGLQSAHYAEPFAGGAAVALDLLFSGYVSHIHINDIDPCVYSFWESAVNDTERLIDKIRTTEVSVESWIAQREIKKRLDHRDALSLGFATFFLNRTNRSGILNGGMIGGQKQAGEWKLDCRFNKEKLIERIRRIGFHRSRISVTRIDAREFIGLNLKRLQRNCLVYIDPPYYIKGAYLYENHYKHDDHVLLANEITSLRHKWVVSYDNAPQIRRIYSCFDQEEFGIGYSARNHNEGTEVMVFANDLARPTRVFSNKKRMKELA